MSIGSTKSLKPNKYTYKRYTVEINIAKAVIPVWTAPLFYIFFKIYLIDFIKEGIILNKIIS